jgi:hypothetical protein
MKGTIVKNDTKELIYGFMILAGIGFVILICFGLGALSLIFVESKLHIIDMVSKSNTEWERFGGGAFAIILVSWPLVGVTCLIGFILQKLRKRK